MVMVATRADAEQFEGPDMKAGLLQHLSRSGFLGALARFDHAAGYRPQAVVRSLLENDEALTLQYDDGSGEHQGSVAHYLAELSHVVDCRNPLGSALGACRRQGILATGRICRESDQ